jgi:hypothetical protein
MRLWRLCKLVEIAHTKQDDDHDSTNPAITATQMVVIMALAGFVLVAIVARFAFPAATHINRDTFDAAHHSNSEMTLPRQCRWLLP